ncbi:MAG TPA: AraC family transcriptional regulator, partial [Balneola sp.]|nr:AraC family transcriptional regulator [Balneola sp.]
SVINHIHHHKNGETFHNLTDYLEREIGKSYSSLSTTFSKNEGRTIEKFSIQQRIERVKELLIYGEKTISEIAFELGYSSTQYLSNQFKSETGLTPTQFKKLLSSNRKPLDEV